MKIFFASQNQHKIKEINSLTCEKNSIYGLEELGILEEIPEEGNTLEENALQKASYVFKKCKQPVFSDDSGLFVKALNGAPGIFSARYAGNQKNDKDNIQALLTNLKNKKDRSAYFKTVIAYIDQKGATYMFEGTITGKITNNMHGTNGFGYDPIFIPEGYQKTFAQLETEIKNTISHRSIAITKFLNYLSENNL